ncbi:MAG TPA: PAS domain-containing sensor histidine kinase [Aggregatilineaceae bacterium]|nr:PAS domain-containing sensor histidine kinase [Aggregatilineaceae bacterium]
MTTPDDWEDRREKIIGLGEKSTHKSYYPELQRRLDELERFRTLLDHSTDAVFLVESPSNRIIDVNKSACEQLGYARSQVLTAVLDQFVPANTAAQISTLLCDETTTESSGTPITTQFHAENCDAVPVEIMVQRVTFGGRVYGILVARDISARLKMEQVLRESEERYHHLFEGIPIGLYRTTLEGDIVDANSAFAEMFGYSDRAALLATNVRELYVDINERERWQALIKQTGIVRNFEIQCRCLDGTIIWVHNTSRAVYDDSGNILFYDGSLEDITERKWIQEELENHRQHLESMVKKRTAELVQANEQLRVLSRVKDEFVSNVSHELRTPITNLKLRHYLLAKHPDGQSDHLAVLQRETERLEQIIESLLYLSRLDQDRVVWNPIPIDLNRLASQIVHDRQALAQHLNLRLSFTEYPDLPHVEADVALLEQALSVLLTNAFNYTPAGGQVNVSTQVGERNAQPWSGVMIRDTGPGISRDDQTHLFERFFRGTAARESGAPGTGLGLAIVQEIINKHQGRIEVSSEGVAGKGTAFTLWLLAQRS